MTKECRGLLLGLVLGLALNWATAEAQGPPAAPPTSSPAAPNVLPPPMPGGPTTGPAPATITVLVPANATIWIGEQQMKQTGTRRTFQSPPLDPTKTYVYSMKIGWGAGPGQKDNATEQEVTIRAGQTTIIDFMPLAQGMPGAPASTAGVPMDRANPPPMTQPQPRSGGFLRRISGTRP